MHDVGRSDLCIQDIRSLVAQAELLAQASAFAQAAWADENRQGHESAGAVGLGAGEVEEVEAGALDAGAGEEVETAVDGADVGVVVTVPEAEVAVAHAQYVVRVVENVHAAELDAHSQRCCSHLLRDEG